MDTTLNFVLDDLKYYPNHSHNSWVEMTLGLGQVGSKLLTAIVVLGISFAFLRIRTSHGAYCVLSRLAKFTIYTDMHGESFSV